MNSDIRERSIISLTKRIQYGGGAVWSRVTGSGVRVAHLRRRWFSAADRPGYTKRELIICDTKIIFFSIVTMFFSFLFFFSLLPRNGL